jgi:hypothetical protein
MSLAVENTKLAIIHRNANNKKTFATIAPCGEMSGAGPLYICLVSRPVAYSAETADVEHRSSLALGAS